MLKKTSMLLGFSFLLGFIFYGGAIVKADVVDVCDSNYLEEVIESELPVLVYAWHPLNGPSIMLMPHIESLSQDYDGSVKVVGINMDTCEDLGTSLVISISDLPVSLGVVNGKEVTRIYGANPSKIEQMIINYLLPNTGNCTAPELIVTDTSESSIFLSWDDEGADSYNVYYRITGAANWETAEVELTVTEYNLTGLSDNTTYEIAVYSICPDGSDPFDTVTAITDESSGTDLIINDIPGQYIREPAANNWHIGTISLNGDSLKWTNEAEISWTLIPDLENEQLFTTDDCPYPGKNFTLVLNQNGDETVEVTGFIFLNETYIRQEEEDEIVTNWLFNNDLLDYSGNNHLTSVNEPVFSTDRVEGSYAVEFNGVDDYLYADLNHSFNSDFTWTAFIKTTDDGTIMAKAPLIGNWARGGKSLFVRNGTLQFDVGWVGVLNSGAAVNDGQWHHVVVIGQINSGCSVDTVKLYVDGELKATKDSWNIDTFSDKGMAIKIGCTNDDFPSVPYFDGLIDDVRIYNRILDIGEITDSF
ncbi:MAG: hypothetical protein GY710_00895 [Desulfobacteraceae bacterium]|nr:hypothetical protein [Desulfobacteraceae bacterium]